MTFDPVGEYEISKRLGVTVAAVKQWRKRGQFPEPDCLVSKRTAVWRWATIKAWSAGTGYPKR